MTIGTLAELKKNSIRVTSETIAVWPQYGNEERVVLPDFEPELFYAQYSINNGVLAFIDGSGFYVTPYTAEAEGILGYNNFRYSSFYVPFSNWDYPRDEYVRWEELLEKAREERS